MSGVIDLTTAQVRALEFCEYCPRLCHFACPTAHGDASETATAWGMMSLANMLRKGEVALAGADAANLWRCTSCRRCTAFCRHENDVSGTLEAVRRELAACGESPEFVSDLARNYAEHGAADVPSAETRDLLATAPVDAAIAYFPSCTLVGDTTGRVSATLEILASVAGEPVALGWRRGTLCCGDAARRAGAEDAAVLADLRMKEAVRGFALVVTDCADLQTGADGPAVVRLMDFLAERVSALGTFDRGSRGAITLHGGCRERRFRDTAAAERRVLEALGYDVVDGFAIMGEQECCGAARPYRAVSPEGAGRAARAVVDGARRTATPLVSSAPRCADHMTASGSEPVAAVIDLVLDSCSTRD